MNKNWTGRSPAWRFLPWARPRRPLRRPLCHHPAEALLGEVTAALPAHGSLPLSSSSREPAPSGPQQLLGPSEVPWDIPASEQKMRPGFTWSSRLGGSSCSYMRRTPTALWSRCPSGFRVLQPWRQEGAEGASSALALLSVFAGVT